jgi:thiol-disulfide isomerase/thioredoxin
MAEENKAEPVAAVHPLDEKPRFDISIPLTLDMFKVEVKDVLNTKLSEMVGNKFIAKRGLTERDREMTTLTDEVGAEYFEGTKFIGLLFSAHWCPPCHTMLKPLRNFYSDINLDERLFEIILVPTDQKKEDYLEHFNSMPWTSLPYGDSRI